MFGKKSNSEEERPRRSGEYDTDDGFDVGEPMTQRFEIKHVVGNQYVNSATSAPRADDVVEAYAANGWELVAATSNEGGSPQIDLFFQRPAVPPTDD